MSEGMHFVFASDSLTQLDSIQEDDADKSQESKKQLLLSHHVLCDITISPKSLFVHLTCSNN